ncbi:VOC family protein [Actinocorallia sp. B10E7]|uniref:VOC family protein n=1 Tax=Actinocorallia sp. B10E7 TaxID=3153558 RepID=UPI00325EFD3F
MTVRPPSGVPILEGRRVGQIGIIVPDMDAALASYSAFCSPGRWRMVEPSDPMPGSTYRGEPGRFSARLAFGGTDPEIELIQSLQGPSVYSEWLGTRGHGVHHLAVFVDSLEDSTRAMESAGYPAVQSLLGYGPARDGGYVFYDTVAELGYFLEAIKLSSR